jgi:hypothetical protein
MKCFENDTRPVGVASLSLRGADQFVKLGFFGERERERERERE